MRSSFSSVEGNLIQTVENVRGRARRSLALNRVDLDENGVSRLALLNEWRDGRIAGIAAVPVRLAVNLYGLEHGGKTGRGEQNVRRYGIVLEHVAAASPRH
jgi:hypothetical protein